MKRLRNGVLAVLLTVGLSLSTGCNPIVAGAGGGAIAAAALSAVGLGSVATFLGLDSGGVTQTNTQTVTVNGEEYP